MVKWAWRHWLALIGVLLIAGSLSALLLADRYCPVFGVFVGCGILCISVAALATPN